jgi:tripartite-type tricarboxylate transporter receptor subunit TctC
VPRPILDRFHAALVKTLNQPELNKQLTEQLGMDLKISDAATLQKFVQVEMGRWAKVVRENGIRAD